MMLPRCSEMVELGHSPLKAEVGTLATDARPSSGRLTVEVAARLFCVRMRCMKDGTYAQCRIRSLEPCSICQTSFVQSDLPTWLT